MLDVNYDDDLVGGDDDDADDDGDSAFSTSDHALGVPDFGVFRPEHHALPLEQGRFAPSRRCSVALRGSALSPAALHLRT